MNFLIIVCLTTVKAHTNWSPPYPITHLCFRIVQVLAHTPASSQLVVLLRPATEMFKKFQKWMRSFSLTSESEIKMLPASQFLDSCRPGRLDWQQHIHKRECAPDVHGNNVKYYTVSTPDSRLQTVRTIAPRIQDMVPGYPCLCTQNLPNLPVQPPREAHL